MAGTQLIYFINTSVKALGSRDHILHIFFVPLHRASEIIPHIPLPRRATQNIFTEGINECVNERMNKGLCAIGKQTRRACKMVLFGRACT